jgi:hypothetical protein
MRRCHPWEHPETRHLKQHALNQQENAVSKQIGH